MAGRLIYPRMIAPLVLFVVICNVPTFGKNTSNKGLVERKAALQDLLKTARGKGIKKPPRTSKTKDGYLRFIAAPRLKHFSVDSGVLPRFAKPEDVADVFLQQYLNLFVNKSFFVGFKKSRVNTSGPRTYVSYQQTYAGLDVFGASMMIQVNAMDGIKAVLSDTMRDTEALDTGDILIQPIISAKQAAQTAIDWMTSKYSEFVFEASEPALMIYCPSVVGSKGPSLLVWQTEVGNISEPLTKELILINAHNGDIALHFSLINELMHRVIRDFNSSSPVLALEDPPGGGDDPCYPTGIDDIDHAYEYLKNSYNFYYNHHNRDSYDNSGSDLIAHVRLSSIPTAGWTGRRMLLGNGYAVEDVIGHELTHGVTQHGSNLFYYGESGAINESLSDMWGEWIDQEYSDNDGNDAPAAKWLIGEDTPDGARRSMKNPPSYSYDSNDYGSDFNGVPHPDRYNSPYYYRETSPYFPDFNDQDNGGVHFNSGVANKLCYLLTDGETFNGYAIYGMDINVTADLFYECQTHLLTSASDYYDLGNLLILASLNLSDELDLTEQDIDNVENACKAVEVAGSTSRFSIKGSDGELVAYFNGSGDLVLLKGTLTQLTTPQATENDEFRFQDSNGNDVMIIDANSGDMYLAGTLYENVFDELVPPQGNNFVLRCSDANIMAYIDNEGNLYLKGRVYDDMDL